MAITTAIKQKRKSPTPREARGELRYEIIYCPKCGRELVEGEFTVNGEDVVMTSYGGVTTKRTFCTHHPEQAIALATYFVVTGRKEG